MKADVFAELLASVRQAGGIRRGTLKPARVTRFRPAKSVRKGVSPMSRIAASEVRKKFATILNEVAFGGERVLLHWHGKDVAAVVPIEDLELLEALEDKMDLKTARRALAEKGSRVKWEQLRKELTHAVRAGK
jgi:prevent-host-death family protein